MSRLNANQARSGFTLMEIMVVIIVIAVLASVAGPMIGTITDQGKSAATKSAMSSLKAALVNFANDFGRFPHEGGTYSSANVNSANTGCMQNVSTMNCLTSNSVNDAAYTNFGLAAAVYAKKWKGPYMDTGAEDFLSDGWGIKMEYCYWNAGIWLHSPGSDGVFNTIAVAGQPGYTTPDPGCDDISMTVSRVKIN